MKTKILAATMSVALSMVCGTHAANAAVITFDALGSEGTDIVRNGPTVAEDGFTLSNPSRPDATAFYTPQNSNPTRPFGQPVLGNNGGASGTLLVADSGLFTLSSIDVSENTTTSGTVSVTFVGTFLDMTTVSQTVTTDGAFGLETFALIGFTNVTKVEWGQITPFHVFDNLVVSAVPLPPAIFFLGSGIVALLFRRSVA